MNAATWRLPRHLHPGAWWLWALGLAAAASRTTNPLLLLLVIAVSGLVVSARRTDAPWARAYRTFLAVGIVVVVIRVAFSVVFGVAPPGGTVLISLPAASLPDFFAGVRLGGPLTLEGLAAAAYDGLRLAAILVCVGAANSLAAPSRLLRCVPGALYEMGVAVVVAMTFAPQVVQSVLRVRAAQRLRGRTSRGLRGLHGIALPVLEESLDRSIALAAAMDSRGYGRRAARSTPARRATAALLMAGLLGVCAGLYGLLDGGSPPLLGLPLLACGAMLAAIGLTVGGRRTPRTRYRPDPWAAPEWLVAATGIAAVAAFVVTAGSRPSAILPSTLPLIVPALPLLCVAGVLVAALPAGMSPPPPGYATGGRRGVQSPGAAS